MSSRRSRLTLSVGEVLIVVAFATGLIIPVTADPTSRAVGGGDARYWLWQGWRLAELVRDGRSPFFVPDVIWPYGSNLLIADGALPSLVGMAWNFVLSPVAAYNAAVVTALATSALAARHLATLFTSRRVVALVTGLAFAAAPAITIRLEGHYNLLFAFPVPLLLAVAIRTVRGEEELPWIKLGALLAIAYVSSGYYFFFGAMAVGVAVLVADQTWRRRASTVVRLGGAAIVAVVLLSPFLVPKLQLERRERAAGAMRISDGAAFFSADLLSAVLPAPGQVVQVEPLADRHDELGGNRLELTSFPGILPLLGVAATVALRSRVRRPLLTAAAALWVASLGPTLHLSGHRPLGDTESLPMAVLLELPGMAGVRAPNRASFALAAVAAACLAYSLAWTYERLESRGRVALTVACLALLVTTVRAPVGYSEDIAGDDVDRALALMREDAEPGDAVIHLPNDCLGNASQIDLQIEHQLPVVGCQGFDAAIPWKTGLPDYFASDAWAAVRCNPGAIAARGVRLPEGVSAEPSPAAFDRLRRQLDVRFVIFDRLTECPGRGEQILAALLGSGATVGDDGRLVVVDLAA